MADTRRSLSSLQTLEGNNTSGDISPQDLRDHLISTHPEKVSQSGTYASEPSSDRLTGDQYWPNNGFHQARWNGTLWEAWGPSFPMKRPVVGDFTLINPGSATLTGAKGGIYAAAPADSAATHVRAAVKTAPSTPYVITAFFIPCILDVDYHSFGMLWRDSGSGKLVLFEHDRSPGLYKMDGPETFNSTYATFAFRQRCALVGMRIEDDGTNRKCSLIYDGQNPLLLHTVGRTDFLTADQVGFYFQAGNATYGSALTVISWKEE